MSIGQAPGACGYSTVRRREADGADEWIADDTQENTIHSTLGGVDRERGRVRPRLGRQPQPAGAGFEHRYMRGLWMDPVLRGLSTVLWRSRADVLEGATLRAVDRLVLMLVGLAVGAVLVEAGLLVASHRRPADVARAGDPSGVGTARG